jgi:hypothetical protein
MNNLNIKPPVDPANPKYYLSKDEMHAALVDYKEKCDAATASGTESPGVSEYLGGCFLRIAQGIAMKHNFRGYSFVNEMIGDGIMVCLKYVRSYDPARRNATTGQATSPLSYFSQAIHFAYINRIKVEAKQSRIKKALIYSADLDSFSLQDDDDAGEFRINLNEFISGLGKEEVEAMISKKPEKAEKAGGLDDFM